MGGETVQALQGKRSSLFEPANRPYPKKAEVSQNHEPILINEK
jgi:hypothetical protein